MKKFIAVTLALASVGVAACGGSSGPSPAQKAAAAKAAHAKVEAVAKAKAARQQATKLAALSSCLKAGTDLVAFTATGQNLSNMSDAQL